MDNYKKANDEIFVSDEKKEELLAAMGNVEVTPKTTPQKILAYAAAFFLMAISVSVFISLSKNDLVFHTTEHIDSESAITLDQSGSFHFNNYNDLHVDKIKMFTVFGEEFAEYDKLPNNIKSCLPTVPVSFIPDEEVYHLLYSENFEEFSLDGYWYTEKGGSQKIAISAGRRKYSKTDFEKLKASQIGKDTEVYFFDGGDGDYGVYYFNGDILLSIRGEGFEKSSFVSIINQLLSQN